MKTKALLCFAIIASLYLITGSKTKAQEIIFSDNFDDGDFSDWTLQRSMQWQNESAPCMYQGQPAAWSIVNGQFGIAIDGPGCVTEITPNQLDLTSVSSFEYEFDWNFKESTHMDRNVIFLWKDPTTWYDVKILDNTVRLQKIINGKSYGFAGSFDNYNFTANNTYHFKISYLSGDENRIIVEVNGQKVIDAIDDAPYIEGYRTLGLQASVGSIRRSLSYFDNLIVRNLDVPVQDGIQLDYEHFMQTDPQWSQEVYDTATRWSSAPTLSRWGCAVTSLAMVMNYHGLTSMPDGSPVNPSTLNAWLKTQVDGYVGDGLTNWIAGTRLTRLISERYGTPKLEYARSSDTTVATAANEITNGKPSILQIAGHFLTASGVTSSGLDLFIKDPAYLFTQFSEHNQPLLSTRTFQPSQTDLSYLLLAHDPSLQISVTDEHGQPIANWESFTEQLQDQVDDSGEQTAVTQLQQLAKPESGRYLVTVSQAEFGPFSFQLFAYDQEATPTDLSQAGYVGIEPITFAIEYDKDGISAAHQQMTFSQFRQDLRLMKDLGQFTQLASYTVLDKDAARGEVAGTVDKKNDMRQHYAKLLATLVKAQHNLITDEGHAYLTQQVSALNETF